MGAVLLQTKYLKKLNSAMISGKEKFEPVWFCCLELGTDYEFGGFLDFSDSDTWSGLIDCWTRMTFQLGLDLINLAAWK